MRIGFIAQPFDRMTPPVRGGSLALWIYYMAGHCTRRGHQATVFGNHGERWSHQLARHEDVEYVFTPTGPDKIVNLWHEKAGRWLTGGKPETIPDFAAAWHHRKYAEQAAALARKRGCDIVHIMNYSQFVPVVRRIHPEARIVLHMQCEWLTQLDRQVIASRLQQTDLIIGCSEHIRRTVAGAFPEFASRCVAVPNAADVPAAGDAVNGRGKTALFVGRLSPEKGVHDLIRAFHLVLRRHPDARLQIVGGAGSAPLEFMVNLSTDPNVTALRVFYESAGNDKKDPYLVALEREAGEELGKRIVFEGAVKHDRIEECYQRASLLVNPSLIESFGISLVEAMMRQLPVVATRTGGMTYTVDPGNTGFLVEPANPAALAEAICGIFSDEDRARQMGEAGRRRAIDRFSWDATADLLLEHLNASRRIAA